MGFRVRVLGVGFGVDGVGGQVHSRPRPLCVVQSSFGGITGLFMGGVGLFWEQYRALYVWCMGGKYIQDRAPSAKGFLVFCSRRVVMRARAGVRLECTAPPYTLFVEE